jgi:hypothetical protein
MNVFRALAVTALFIPGLACAGDLLSKDQFIDYQSQMRCAEMLYSYTDPAKHDKEQTRIDKSFNVKDKDIENGRIDELMEKYGADAGVLDAIDVKVNALCPDRG